MAKVQLINKKEAVLLLVVALTCEAKPLLACGTWQKIKTAHRFIIYQRLDKPLWLIISGVGAMASAMATSVLLQSYVNDLNAACVINFGTAGAQEAAMGTGYSIHKITDALTQRHWYLQPQLNLAWSSATCITHTTPQLEYFDNALVDMEASGFVQAASMFVSLEKTVVLKLISDNASQSSADLNRKKISALVAQAVPELETIFDKCLAYANRSELPQSTVSSQELVRWQQRWHFTHTRALQLQACLYDVCVLSQQSPEHWWQACQVYQSAQAVIEYLKQQQHILSGEVLHVQ